MPSNQGPKRQRRRVWATKGARGPCAMLLAVTASCSASHSKLAMTIGTAKQGEAGVQVVCNASRHGAWKGRDCGPMPQLRLSAVSDCAVSGRMLIEIISPDESRVQEELEVQLPLGTPTSFPGPCFSEPKTEHATVVMSVRAQCTTVGDALTASARCVMP